MNSLHRCLFSILALAGLLGLAACGGGGSGAEEPVPPLQGSRSSSAITSNVNGSSYPLQIYLPPASAGPRSSLPVLYALDGVSWFETLVGIAERNGARIIIVAIGNAPQRGRDYVPQNICTPNGGGHTAFLQFLAQELIPFIETNYGGNPARRALMGHSHGGSFALYAMFAQAPGTQLFSAFLASDASISCMPSTTHEWEQAYAAAHGSRLPVRLHLSYATQGNFSANDDYVRLIQQRQYTGLVMSAQAYQGTHNGIVPAVLGDGVPFAFADRP